MVGHNMPLFDPALLVSRQRVKRFSKILLDYAVELSPAIFRYEYDVVFALPSGMI
jgi:hypothetical protein